MSKFRVLEKCHLTERVQMYCGDQCCSWFEYESELVLPGMIIEIDDGSWTGFTEDSINFAVSQGQLEIIK